MAGALVAFGSTALAGAGSAEAGGGASEVRVERDVVWRTVDGQALTLDAYLPTPDPVSKPSKGTTGAQVVKRPTVLLVHGGGWRSGDKSSLAEQGEALAALGYNAFSVNYRLAPTHLYPAAVDDVEAAVKWLRAPAQVKRYGIDPKRVGALGSSAGAHLVALLGTLGRGARDTGSRVRAVVEWSGPMDFTAFANVDPASLPPAQRDSWERGAIPMFLGCLPAQCPDTAAEASPVTHVDKTDAPMLLVNSTDEMVPASQAQAMDAALRAAGVKHELILVPGARHARALAPDVWDDTVAFFERHLGTPPR
jgi:acetyl esterase/lipase